MRPDIADEHALIPPTKTQAAVPDETLAHADVRKVVPGPMPYPSTMSRWDHPEPSSGERWLVRHRTLVNFGAVLVLVLGACRIAYLLLTDARLGWSLDGSISMITTPCLFLFLSWSANKHVHEYDNARNQDPKAE